MEFTTKIPIPTTENPIRYDSKIVSLGSCFAVNIAEKLDYFKFQNRCNPFGILFHPMAIHEIIRRSLSGQAFTDEDIVNHNDLWHSLDVHSELSHPDKETILNHLNAALDDTRESLQNATHLILTYGTAWVYRYKASQKIVANCHKIPQSQFEKELLSVETIAESIAQTIQLVRGCNPNCRIMVTISPVRHIKDGFIENQRSKAHLIAAIHSLGCEAFNYFPSYEIVMDELRDYRFYASDMLHPNPTAIDYIWERFSETHIHTTAAPVMLEIDSIQKALRHKPFQAKSLAHQDFLVKLNSRIAELQAKFPQINF